MQDSPPKSSAQLLHSSSTANIAKGTAREHSLAQDQYSLTQPQHRLHRIYTTNTQDGAK